MSIRLRAKCVREIYHNDNFYILGFVPVGSNREIQLNQYGNFTCSGELGFISVNKEYELVVQEKNGSKYGVTYEILEVPSMVMEDLSSLSYQQKFEILMECTTSERIATNILEGEPNYIELAVTKGEDSIDVSKIRGVAKKLNHVYCKQLIKKYKYYAFCQNVNVKEYELNITDAKKMFDEYSTQDKILSELQSNPYYALIEVLGRSFERTDKLLMNIRNDLKTSNTRCEALIIDVLKKNEMEGSSRLNGSILYQVVRDDYSCPELIPMLKTVSESSDMIYFDQKSGDLSIMATYLAECEIASFIMSKNKNPHVLDIDWTKYTKLESGVDMTDKQAEILKLFCKKDVMVLCGYSGCVDSETEFFNGKGWKKISDYTNDDLVLQYNEDGTAELVEPLRYIKEPCDEMYHFETKYGINQTLSGDHRVIYKGKSHNNKIQSYLSEITMDELYNKHYSGNGFLGKFITTFDYSGNGIDLTDQEIRLMVATMADGSFYNTTNENRPSYKTCRFHIKKERKKERLRKLFEEAGVEYREVQSANIDYTDFYYTAPRREKEYTEYWYNCNHHQLEIICDEVFFWDGSVNVTKNGKTRRRFSTNLKTTADFIQFALTSCGYRSTISIRDRRGREKVSKYNRKIYIDKSIEYNVTATDRILCSLSTTYDKHTKKTEITKVKPADGYKYCFTVPSHMLVLRRKNKIFITGNCGKTTSVAGLINLMEDNGITYTLLSPSGKASRVLSESTHRKASTVHRACYSGNINSDCIILDEASMLSLDVMAMLIHSISNPNAKIVFVEDNKQLCPVGLSKIGDDLIESNVIPKVMLTEVFRYTDNGSLFVATNIRQGKNFLDDTEMVKCKENVYSVSDNYKFINVMSQEDIFDEVVYQYKKLIDKGIKQDDILVLSPQNVGSIGTYAINNAIQKEYNPPLPNEKVHTRKINGFNITFRVNDLVINKKNDYNVPTYDGYLEMQSDNRLEEDDVETTMVLNGQIGKIVDVIDKGLLIKFDEEIVYFNKSKLNNLLLGYSIGTYSAQGSTCLYSIGVVTNAHKRMLSKALLYVETTRCRKSHIDIGQIDAFEYALTVDDTKIRNTWLKELLINWDNTLDKAC